MLNVQRRAKGIKIHFDEHGLSRTKVSNWKHALTIISSVPPNKLIDIEAPACLVTDYEVLA